VSRPAPHRKGVSVLTVLSLVASLLTVFVVLPTVSAQAEANSTGVPVYNNNTFHAFVRAGETLDVSFTKDVDQAGAGGATSTTFTAVDPGGTTRWTCTPPRDCPASREPGRSS
jgi:acyl dehydratase